jgi:hypothetical protein
MKWVSVIVLALSVSLGLRLDAQSSSRARIPEGFAKLTPDFWRGPWVFDGGDSGEPLPRLHHTLNDRSVGPIPIRLDDGSTGTLRVIPQSMPDAFWIEVDDSTGKRVLRLDYQAAYGAFDVVPVDLLDGPGEELMTIQMGAHSSPPMPPDLTIWRIDPPRAVDIIRRRIPYDLLPVGGRLITFDTAIPCAEWRARLFVDRNDPKPRPIAWRVDFAADGWPPNGCRLTQQGKTRMADVRDGQILRFTNGKYDGRRYEVED